MLTSDFDYNLPKQLIAQIPLEPRDSSRLMVIDKKLKKIEHQKFYGIVDYLKKGDLLVWNNTKVFKARLKGRLMLDEAVVPPLFKEGTRGGQLTPPHPPLKKGGVTTAAKILNVAPVEIFLVKPMENNMVWKVLAKPGRKLRLGMKIVFVPPQRDPALGRDIPEWSAEVMLKENDGTFLIQFAEDDMSVRAKANKYGEVPVPPYIRTSAIGLQTSGAGRPKSEDRSLIAQYQTVYAKEEGSVAAPTAGFHFTPELIAKLKAKGVEFAEVTLHVGLGTFLPVKTAKVEDHKMHSEWVEVTAKNADLINQAKAEGRRVVAVGTTTVRALEGVARLSPSFQEGARPQRLTCPQRSRLRGGRGVAMAGAVGGVAEVVESQLRPFSGDINIFIYPGFKFKVVDALITNFHLPKSTLLMLVCAFANDREFVLRCYDKAVAEKYRFFSFGDAMLVK